MSHGNEAFGRHTVNAAQIAPVGNRDAHVINGAVKIVSEESHWVPFTELVLSDSPERVRPLSYPGNVL